MASVSLSLSVYVWGYCAEQKLVSITYSLKKNISDGTNSRTYYNVCIARTTLVQIKYIWRRGKWG